MNMDGILQWIIDNANDLTNYINYFFIALAAIAVIGFIAGVIRGTYRALSMLLCFSACIVTVIFLCNTITHWVYSLDLSAFGVNFGTDASGNAMTSLGSYAENYLKTFFEDAGVEYSTDSQMHAAILAIAFSLVNIVVYLALFILSILVAFILHVILYNTLGRLIFSRKRRRHHKMRPLGGLITAISFTLSFTLFLSPFTGILNGMTAGVRDESGKITKKENDNKTYQAVMNVLDAYNNSMVSKMFFALTFGQDQSFDVQLMDFISQSSYTYNDKTITIKPYSEFSGLANVLVSALETGFYGDKINYSLLIDKAFLQDLFSYVGNSTLLQTLFAVGMTFAASTEQIKSNIDLTSLDFFGIDWSNTATALSDTFGALFDAGVIDDIKTAIADYDEATSGGKSIGEVIMEQIYVDHSNVQGYKDAVETLGNNEAVSKVMTLLLVSFAKSHNESISSSGSGTTALVKKANGGEEGTSSNPLENLLDGVKLPETEEFYNTIRWGDELSILINMFSNLSDHYYAYSGGNHLSLNNFGDAFGENALDFIFGMDTVQTYSTYEEKYSNNVFLNGGTYIKDGVSYDVPGVKSIIGVKSGEQKTNGLFDLGVIGKIIDETDVLKEIVGNIDLNALLEESGVSADASKTQAAIDLVKDYTLAEWKDEMNGLCDVLLPALDLATDLNDNKSDKKFIFGRGDQIEYLFSTVDNSNLMKKLIPTILDAAVGDKLTFGEGDDAVKPSFDNIENWALEGHYINSLLTTMNDVMGSATSLNDIDFLALDDEITQDKYDAAVIGGYTGTFDDYYIENSKVYDLLESVYDTQIIGGKYTETGERTNGIFSSMLQKILATALETVDENLNLDTCAEANLIDNDFNLGGGKVVYSGTGDDKIYVSWLGKDTYRGELANITLLVKEASSLSGETKLEDMGDVILRLNDCYILRTAMNVIIDNKINAITDEGLIKDFVSKADFSVLHKEAFTTDPYNVLVDTQGKKVIDIISTRVLNTRLSEIQARREEINHLVDALNLIDDIKTELDKTSPTDSFYSAKLLVRNQALTASLDDDDPIKTSEEKSLLEQITTILKDSKIFNTPKYAGTNRDGTTAFEYLFQYITGGDVVDVSSFLVDLKTNPSILYEITSDEGWDEEIASFNAGLYGVLQNQLLKIIDESSSDQLLDNVSSIITSGNTPIQDLFESMGESRILSQSIGYALDQNFLPKIVDNLDYDKTAYLVDENLYSDIEGYYHGAGRTSLKSDLSLYGASSDVITLSDTNVQGAFWKNEGAVLEEAIKAIVDLDFTNINLDAETLDVSGLTSAIRHSLVLNYLNEEDPATNKISLTTTLKVRSVYQMIAIKSLDIACDKLEGLVVPNDETDYTTTDDIVSYDNEINVIETLLTSYKDVYSLVDKDADSIVDEDVTKLDNFLKNIFNSSVFNYTYQTGNTHKLPSDTHNEHSYFERLVMKLDDSLKDALVNVLGLSASEANYTSSEDIVYSTKNNDIAGHLDTAKANAYMYEASLVTRAMRIYIEAKDVLSDTDIVDNLTETNKDKILELFNVLKESVVFNYPIGELSPYSANDFYKTPDDGEGYSKHSDHSLYEHIAIYLVNKMNTALNSGVSIDISEAGAKRIESYDKEINTIFNVILAYQGINSYLSAGDFNLTSANANAIADAFKELLSAIYPSDVYHYVRSDSWNNRGDELTVFEQLISKLLVTASLDDSIYNADNPSHAGLSNGEQVIKMRIEDISNNELLTSGDSSLTWLSTGGEIDKLCNIIRTYDQFSFDSSADDLSAYIQYDSVNDEYTGILPIVNDSYLLHDIVSTMAREFTIKAEIDDGNHNVGDVGYQGMLIDSTSTFGYYVVDGDTNATFAQKVTRWNIDIYKLIEISENVDEIINSTNVITLAASSPFHSVIPNLSETELFGEVVDELTISIMHQAAIDTSGFSTNLGKFINVSDDLSVVYGTATSELNTLYGANPVSWDDESTGLDTFLVGLSSFITSYVAYALQRNNGLSATYPTWTGGTTPGALLAKMIEPSSLQGVFPII